MADVIEGKQSQFQATMEITPIGSGKHAFAAGLSAAIGSKAGVEILDLALRHQVSR